MDSFEKNKIISQIVSWLHVKKDINDGNEELTADEKKLKLQKALDLFEVVVQQVKIVVRETIDTNDYANMIVSNPHQTKFIDTIKNKSLGQIIDNEIYDRNDFYCTVLSQYKSPYGKGIYQADNMECSAFVALPSLKDQSYMTDKNERRYDQQFIRERSYFNRSDRIMTITDQTGYTLTIQPASGYSRNDNYSYWTGNNPKLMEKLKELYDEHKTYSNGRLVIRDEYIMTPEYASKLVNQATGGMLNEKDWLNKIIGELLVKHPYYNTDTRTFMPLGGAPAIGTVGVQHKIMVVIETTVTPDNRQKFCTPPATGVMVTYGDYGDYINVKNSLRSLDGGYKYLMDQKTMSNGTWVTVVDKEHKPYTLYYKLGNLIKSVESVQHTRQGDAAYEDGIYVFTVIVDDLSVAVPDNRILVEGDKFKKGPRTDSIVNVERYPLNEASKHGFFINKADVEINGNLDNAIALKAQQNKLEILDKEKEVKTTDIASTQVKQEVEAQSLIRKEEFETKQHEFNMERLMNDFFHKSELNELEREKHATKYYYEAKSLDRKDTSEGLKIIPGIITGLASVGAALLTVSMVTRASTSTSVMGGALATGLAMFTVPLPLVIGLSIVGGISVINSLGKFVSRNSDTFANMGSAVKDVVVRAGSAIYGAGKTLVSKAWSTTKYVGGALWSGAKAAGSATWSGVKAVGRGISNVSNWVGSWFW